ncbi:hypothetical protein FA15DRAFT_703815 [Coprinopsis marcescibilis]|uniref:Uncharacterized protein n=1 Tax=Coprinopsis marcescibilis TaxID=230819 RepID=A0A5C3KY78_COPMA|nr:hypothetical protein FA15DRAFT_703815 [Coprinopsis marcescibilis]
MATRSFTVFQDTPLSNPTRSGLKSSRAPSGVLVARSSSRTNLNSTVEARVILDKENFNPVTGERTTQGTAAEKKRKTLTVLAAKEHVATSSKKSKAEIPEAKKRKTSSLKAKPAAIKAKDSKTVPSTRKPKRNSPSRRASPLPKVEEEKGNEADNRSQAQESNQAAIDSRCYELTVKPLADVSDAYVVPESSSCSRNGENTKGPFQMIKEASVEPEIRDYFSPKQASSLVASSLERFAEEENQTSYVFSTPERKKIYSSFTFTSPSPSGQRFRDLVSGSRAGSPPPFILDTATPP